MTLKVGTRTPVECDRVEVNGSCVMAYSVHPRGRQLTLLYAYCLQPGEIVTRGRDGGYEVVQ